MEISVVSSEEPGILKCCRRRREITEHSLVMKILEKYLILCHPLLFGIAPIIKFNIKCKMLIGLIL